MQRKRVRARMHVGTERDISKSLIAKILLQIASRIQVKVNSSKSLTRLCFRLDHYIKNSTLLFSTVDLSSDSNLTTSFQVTVLFRNGINISKSYICILSGGYTNKILKQTNYKIEAIWKAPHTLYQLEL